MNRLTRILPLAVGLIGSTLIFGCTNDLVEPDVPAFAQTRPEPIRTFTSCKPQPYASATGMIGPLGGILRAGKHTLKVPPGALSTPTQIKMQVPTGNINAVIFEPHGLTFDPKYAVSLAMSYSNCSVDAGSRQEIVYVTSEFGILEPAPSVVDAINKVVYGKLSHFSDYALSTYAVVY